MQKKQLQNLHLEGTESQKRPYTAIANSIKSSLKSLSKKERSEIIQRNLTSQSKTLPNISKYLKVIIYEFLSPKEIFHAMRICRTMYQASNEPGTWERYIPLHKNQEIIKLIQDQHQNNGTNPGILDDQQFIVSKKRLYFLREQVTRRNICERKLFQQFNLIGHDQAITCLDSLNIGVVASGSKDKTVRVWDFIKMKSYKLEGAHKNWIQKVQFINRQDGKSLVTAGTERFLCLWEYNAKTKNYELQSTIKDHLSCINGIDSIELRDGNPEEKQKIHYSFSSDGTAILWDFSNLRKPKKLAQFSDHQESSIRYMKHNQRLLASYSPDSNQISIRDYHSPGFSQVCQISNDALRNSMISNVTQGNNTFMHEIGDFLLTQDNLLITSDQKRIRIWDLRSNKQTNEFREDVNEPREIISHDAFSFKSVMKYYEDEKELIVSFRGGENVHKFDIRKNQSVDSYGFHDYPISSFTTGKGVLNRVGVSIDPMNKFCVYDFNKSSNDHNKSYKIACGVHSIIYELDLNENFLVSGSIAGDIKICYFPFFQSEIRRASSVINLKHHN
ncbi:nacht and wd domain protein [Stylonychia lemnae]|uniref:Nacht and wd domain protein n=1 Tax=Stylonychia lemnae TaxID=5949 RepID=A0A078AHN4_STYLE|nr:nacht and wd domain protein [Stylonychia lemnae]|eukprot:CDW81790.1 nacht and wd domain protein [Stylonychia lemnae]